MCLLMRHLSKIALQNFQNAIFHLLFGAAGRKILRHFADVDVQHRFTRRNARFLRRHDFFQLVRCQGSFFAGCFQFLCLREGWGAVLCFSIIEETLLLIWGKVGKFDSGVEFQIPAVYFLLQVGDKTVQPDVPLNLCLSVLHTSSNFFCRCQLRTNLVRS